MIRFKVVRASRLLLAVSIILLVAVLAVLGARLFGQGQQSAPTGSAKLVNADPRDGAETTSVVFAPSGDGEGTSTDPKGEGIRIEIVDRVPKPARPVRILIYHTHTHEAYEQVEDDPYDALEAWRTADADHSVIRVGQALAESLERYGYEVVHDLTDNEGDQLSTAYARSLATLRRYDERFDLYIDLHRDAWVEGEPLAFTSTKGESMAPLMMLIGNGNGFDEKPWYRQNYAFARALEARVNAIEPGLCKPVMVKDGRYNQHIGVFSILVEVGHNRNTLRQALNAVEPLAKGLYALMTERPDAELVRMKTAWERDNAGA